MDERERFPRRVLPRRLRTPRLLIAGTGDVGLRLAVLLRGRVKVIALVRRPEAAAAARSAGAVPVTGDLDDARSLRRAAALATRVAYLAPPPAQGTDDPRVRRLLAARARAAAILARRGHPAAGSRWAYVSTTGVYGDHAGAWIDERTPRRPESERARRRVAAEDRLRAAARTGRLAVSVLRAPGIYAADRLPDERVRRGLPALVPEEDGYTNHIHADDLARAVWVALMRAPNGRAYDAVDGSRMKMGDWFDAVADALGLPRPPRLPRDAVRAAVSPQMWSFMRESRRIRGERIGRELRLRLRYPTVREGLRAVRPD